MVEWTAAEDLRPALPSGKVALANGSTYIWIIRVEYPAPCLARVILRQIDGGDWTIERGRVWPVETEDDAS